MWNNEYLYLGAMALLVLCNTITMVFLLLDRRELNRLRKVIEEAEAEFLRHSATIENYKHLDALARNGIYATRNLKPSDLTKRNFSSTLH